VTGHRSQEKKNLLKGVGIIGLIFVAGTRRGPGGLGGDLCRSPLVMKFEVARLLRKFTENEHYMVACTHIVLRQKSPFDPDIRQVQMRGYTDMYLQLRQTFFPHSKTQTKTVLSNELLNIFPRKPPKKFIRRSIISQTCPGKSLLRCWGVGISAL
jgi:hypothetical protein